MYHDVYVSEELPWVDICIILRRRRQYFRSDVLVKFNPPLRFTPAVCARLFRVQHIVILDL